MKKIVSKANPTFKALKKLEGSARERKKRQRTILEGRRLVQCYLQTAGRPLQLVVSADSVDDERLGKILETAEGAEAVVLERGLFRELSILKSPSGIMAEVTIPGRERLPEGKDLLLLEGVQDPGNLGMAIRSAAAAGMGAIFTSPACADPWSPKALRAGMGGHFQLPIGERAELVAVARKFQGEVIAVEQGADQSIFETDLTGPVGFIVGGEGQGISRALREEAGTRASIPMPGWGEPLNAAAAATVCLFEMVRQRSL